MDNKAQLITYIKEWVQLDNEMTTLCRELRERRQKKKDLTHLLVETMKEHDIDCVNMAHGKLIYSQNKVKTPLNKKHLLHCLSTYFQGNEETANELSRYIMESREVKIKDIIRQKS